MLNSLLIAVGLAMDAFAVSISSGISLKKHNLKIYLTFGLVFGFFQTIMPILGYYGSMSFSQYFSEYTNIISFVLLIFIGGKMLYESLKGDDDENEVEKSDSEILNIKNMVLLGIATSIDALAVGILIQINNQSLLKNCIIIGIVAFLFSFVGVIIGKKVGDMVGSKAEILGGVILIFLAFKFLLF